MNGVSSRVRLMGDMSAAIIRSFTASHISLCTFSRLECICLVRSMHSLSSAHASRSRRTAERRRRYEKGILDTSGRGGIRPLPGATRGFQEIRL